MSARAGEKPFCNKNAGNVSSYFLYNYSYPKKDVQEQTHCDFKRIPLHQSLVHTSVAAGSFLSCTCQ